MTSRPATVLLALIAGLTSLTAWADRTLLTGEGLQVLVPDSNVWCTDRAAVVIRAARAGDFADESRLQRLLGGVRAVLSVECPAAQTILMLGTVGATTDIVYRANARAANDWRLVTEIAPPVAQPAAPPPQPARPTAPPAPTKKSTTPKRPPRFLTT